MTISPFGFFLIIYYTFILATKSRKECFILSLVVLLICSLTVQMGYFFSIGEKAYSFSMVATIASAFFAWRAPIHNEYSLSKQKQVSTLVICSIIISFLGLKYFPYGGTIIENSDYEGFFEGTAGFGKLMNSDAKYGYLYVLVFLLNVLYRIRLCLEYSDLLNICKKFLNNAFVLVIIVGFSEFVIENFFNSLFITDTTISLFGEVKGQQYSLDLREGLYAVQGTTKEASMYSVSLLYTAIIAICQSCYRQSTKEKNKYLLFFYLLLLLMLINRSMSSYIYAFIAIYIYAYLNPKNIIIFNNKKLLVYSLFGLVSFIIILPSLISILNNYGYGDNYFISRLSLSNEEFDGFSSGEFSKSSEGIRYIGIYYCLEAFKNRPLFGVGISNLTCLSGLVSLLTTIGVIGSYFWLKLCTLFANTTISKSFVPMLIVLILPNILLNDVGTMLSFSMPFVFSIFVLITENKYVETNHHE